MDNKILEILLDMQKEINSYITKMILTLNFGYKI